MWLVNKVDKEVVGFFRWLLGHTEGALPAAAGPSARPAGPPPGAEVTRWAPGAALLEGKPGQVSPRGVRRVACGSGGETPQG